MKQAHGDAARGPGLACGGTARGPGLACGGAARDPEQAWASLWEAARENRERELADLAFSLYGQLGEARAEISRLRAALRARLPAHP